MNHLIVPILSLCIGVGVVLADTPMPSQDRAVVNTIKHLEDEMGDAMIRRDIDRLSQIYADDVSGRFVWMDLLENRGGKWVVVRSDGTRIIEPAPAAADGRRPRVLL